MRKTAAVIIFLMLSFKSFTQSVRLIQGDTTIYPLYAKENLFRSDTIRVKLNLQGTLTKNMDTITFSLDNSSIVHPDNKPVLPPYANTILISGSRWNAAVTTNNSIDTFLLIQVPASTNILRRDEVARIYIAGRPNDYMQIRLSADRSKAAADNKIILHQFAREVDITPFDDDGDTPHNDSVRIKLKFMGKYSAGNSVVHVYIDTPAMPNNPRIINPVINIDTSMWNRGTLDTCIYIASFPVIDTGRLKSAFCALKIKEDTINSILLSMTYKGKKTWLKKSNFFVGSFIKSISGSTSQSEMLDIFLKVNLTSRDRLEKGRGLLFGFFGADAGLKSDTIGKKGLPLNEAMISINWAPHFLTGGEIGNNTNRMGFIGGGLKVFYSNAYVGLHAGVSELGGVLKHSYLLAGFYHSPWLPKIAGSTTEDTLKTPAYYFRNNIYFEAAFNAFGDNAPKALQYIRLKFGLMLPVKSKDAITPDKTDFLYRLAVEVPIGGPLRF